MSTAASRHSDASLLYAAVLETEGFIVGGSYAPAGMYRLQVDGTSEHLGWPNVRGFGVAVHPQRPHELYLAAGNGILRSLDDGRSWRQLADWRITEVEDVALDPHAPETIYLATSFGPWASRDAGSSWVHLTDGIPSPRSTFTQTIAVDAAVPGVVVAGTECGLYRSEEAGAHWWPVGPRVPIRDLHQDTEHPGLWLAGTDGCGILISTDGGRTWNACGGALESSTIWAVAAAGRGGVLAAAGYRTGIHLSANGGQTWTRHPAVFPERHVHALAFDPEIEGRLWAGTVGDGVWHADPGDVSWSFAGLPGATVWDLLPRRIDEGVRSFIVRPSGVQPISSVQPGRTMKDLTPSQLLDAGYAERCSAIIDFYASREASGYIDFVEFIEVAARLYRNRPLEEVLPMLDPILAEPRGDVFWMYPMVLICYLAEDRLPDDYRQRLRDLWRTYTPYRGDTENHWAMYYASLYLAAQLYPGDRGETWFNGRSSDENLAEAREYLESWVELTTTLGQGEYDSPHYLPFFITPMALLFAFTRDEDMKKRAGMMLDYLIADFAVDSLAGQYVGAFSRIYPEPALERWRNGSTSLAWLLFGNVPFRPDGINVILPMPGYRPHAVAAILAMSGYVPPEILSRIATDRSTPYVHRELKRTRHRIRHSDVKNVPVYKYVYMTGEFALGSTQGGLLQPVQQHTWELFWRTDDPHEGFNVFFALHPYSSPYELAMYFPEEPQLMTEAVLKGKKETYDSPDKLTGGSPFEQVFQHRSTLIALYDIPAGTRFPHVSGYFSRKLLHVERDPSGWIFSRGSNALFACFPLAPYEWQDEPGGDLRMHCPHLKCGFVIQVVSASAFDDAAFRAAVRDAYLEGVTDPVPSVRYRTIEGDLLTFAYGSTPTINGVEVDYEQWPLFDGPFMRAARGSGRLELAHGKRRRLLDFQTLTIIESAPAALAPQE